MNLVESLEDLAHAADLRGHPLIAQLPPRLSEVDAELAALRGPDPLAAIAADLFAAGGKRLRAMAVLTVAGALDVPAEAAQRFAAAVEATHGASLLHDDVIDESDERRGRPAARRRWCNTLSILGGDHLLLSGLRAVWRLGNPELLEAHLDTLETVLAAEVLQHQAKERLETSTAGYLDIARGKTGALFAHACAGPAVLAADRRRARSLHSFGLDLGVAFQIADDLRDVLGLDPTKPAALDLVDAVLSLPLRVAARADPAVEAALRAGARGALAAADVPEVIARVRGSGAIESAAAVGDEHLARAQTALAAVGLERELGALAAVGRWLERDLASFREIGA